MSENTTFFFNVITIIFLALTLLVGLMVLSVASGSMEPPILAPGEDDPLPTEYVPITLTPSPIPPGVSMVGTPPPDAD